MLVFHKQADAGQNELIIKKWIRAAINFFDRLASFFVENVKPEIEAAQQFDVRTVVLVEVPPEGMEQAAQMMMGIPGLARPATITYYDNNEVWIDVQTNEPSWLILTDMVLTWS